MEQIYYNDIDAAASTGNFNQIFNKLKLGVSVDDTTLLINELIRRIDSGYILTLERELSEIKTSAYEDVGDLIHDRTNRLEEMPEDTVLTKEDVILIMNNLEYSVGKMCDDD